MDPVEMGAVGAPANLGTGPVIRHGPSGRRIAAWLLLGAAVLQVAFVFLWVRPGPLSIDEVIYQWMAQDVAAGHMLALDNGFEVAPSPELATYYMIASGDRLVAQYPYGYPFLAAPASAVFRLHGLFLVNALAFIAALALMAHVGMRLLRDRIEVALGVGVLLVGTFAWEYSMAAWPHALALVSQLGAFAVMLAALDAREPGRRLWLAAAAGVLGGLGATFRLDNVFVVAALALPFLLAVPIRWRELAALAAGTLPALLFLGVTNWLRWGNPSPFSYGLAGGLLELRRYVPILAAGLLAVGLLVGLTRPRMRAVIGARPQAAWAGALAAAALLLLIPDTRALAFRLGHGLRVLLVDLRGEPANFADGQRVSGFAMIYAGGIKKALLQSCPWLPVVALPFLMKARNEADRRALLLLALVPAVLVPIYSFFSWHGGLSLNLRYFLPALPFLALLAGRALRDLARGLDVAGIRAAGLAGATAMALYALLITGRPRNDPTARAIFVLDVPLAIAAVIAILVGAVWLRSRGRNASAPAPLRRAALVALGVGIGWSGCLAFEYDAAWSRWLRGVNLLQAVAVAPGLTDDALLFGYSPDYFATVRNLRPEVTVAFPRQDGYEGFHSLAVRWLDTGRPVFAVLTPYDWNVLRSGDHLEGLEFRVAAEGSPFPLMELRRRAVPDGG